MRIDKIDFLRFLGLALIILAHTQPPLWLAQLRNFDVPLMFMVMGMSFYVTEDNYKNKLKYIISRFRRLVLPTWIFFAFFFLINECIASIFNIKNFTYSEGHIITSFTLSSGLGYVWVIRLFFMISIIAILLPKKILNAKFLYVFFLFACIVIVNTVFKNIYKNLDEMNKMFLLGSYISNTLPYIFVFLLGYRMMTLNDKKILKLIFFSSLVFFALVIYNYLLNDSFTPTQTDKYPPGIYYLSYAIFMCALIFLYADNISECLQKTPAWKLVSFTSSNSIWIYLWHIPFILMCYKLKLNFVFTFFTTYTLTLFIVYSQVKITKFITDKIDSKKTSKIITSIFTG